MTKNMDEKVNILFGYCPCYPENIAMRLLENPRIHICVNATDYMNRISNDGRYIGIAFPDADLYGYEYNHDINSLPALDKKLLEKMLPYESMAIKLGRRRASFPNVEYEEEKLFYHKHLRYWNYILDEYDINLIYFDECPHVEFTYIIYCLAIIKNIRIIMTSITGLQGLRIYGDRIETIGSDIKVYFETYAKKLNVDEIVLEGQVKCFYEKYNDNTTKVANSKMYRKREFARINKFLYGDNIGIKSFLRPWRRKIRLFLKHSIRDKNHELYQGLYKVYLNQLKREKHRAFFFKREIAMGIRQYDKIASNPCYNEKYIYYALQLDPEETTMPKAGVFAEQYTSISLLARASEKENVKVYVKEHFVQAFRDKRVYDYIDSIQNVRLIKSTYDSLELMRHSIAVATQTGTCILESAIIGKPALVFGSGYCWKGLPSVFEMVDENQGSQIIRMILDGYKINADDIKRYFFSIQKCAYKLNVPDSKSGDKEEEITKRVRLISEKMEEDYADLEVKDVK